MCEFCEKEEADEQEAEKGVNAAMGPTEKRLDTDNKAYTKEEFYQFYGESKGKTNWRAAKKADTRTRWTKEGGKAAPLDEKPEDADLNALIRACREDSEMGKLVKITELGACGAESKHFAHVACKRYARPQPQAHSSPAALHFAAYLIIGLSLHRIPWQRAPRVVWHRVRPR